jgi:hypothetical protein
MLCVCLGAPALWDGYKGTDSDRYLLCPIHCATLSLSVSLLHSWILAGVGKGFDSYFGYFDGYNDYLHSLSGTSCPDSGNVTYVHSKADATKCTGSSVVARHLTTTTDLWLNDHPAHGLNGTGYEEAMFAERVLGIIAGHDPSVPLFLYYPMHLVHSPLCV